MAKTNNLDSTKIAMESAAMKEGSDKLVTKPKEVTQAEGSKHISLKKFPKEWHDILKDNHVNNITEYILSAVRKEMKRDGLL